MVAYKRASSFNTDASSGTSLTIGRWETDTVHTTTINGYLNTSYINRESSVKSNLVIGHNQSDNNPAHTLVSLGNFCTGYGYPYDNTNNKFYDGFYVQSVPNPIDEVGLIERSGIMMPYKNNDKKCGNITIYSRIGSSVGGGITIGTLSSSNKGLSLTDSKTNFDRMNSGIYFGEKNGLGSNSYTILKAKEYVELSAGSWAYSNIKISDQYATVDSSTRTTIKSSTDVSIKAGNSGTISLDAQTVQLNAAISYGSIIDVSTSGKSIDFANTPYFILKTHATLNAGSSGGAYDTRTTNIPNDTMLVLIQESDNTCSCQRSAYAYFTMNGTTETHSVEHKTYSSGLGIQVKLLFFHKSGSRSIMKVI